MLVAVTVAVIVALDSVAIDPGQPETTVGVPRTCRPGWPRTWAHCARR
jgi:hypothetical protein